MNDPIRLRTITVGDREWLPELIRRHWGSTRMVSRGRLHDLTSQPGLLAYDGDKVVGLLLYEVVEKACEITLIQAMEKRRGIGKKLLEKMADLALRSGWERLWLITTNDNLAAQRFYEAVGWTLVAIHPGAVNEARALKPEIPLIGLNGIPLTDEHEYALL